MSTLLFPITQNNQIPKICIGLSFLFLFFLIFKEKEGAMICVDSKSYFKFLLVVVLIIFAGFNLTSILAKKEEVKKGPNPGQ